LNHICRLPAELLQQIASELIATEEDAFGQGGEDFRSLRLTCRYLYRHTRYTFQHWLANTRWVLTEDVLENLDEFVSSNQDCARRMQVLKLGAYRPAVKVGKDSYFRGPLGPPYDHQYFEHGWDASALRRIIDRLPCLHTATIDVAGRCRGASTYHEGPGGSQTHTLSHLPLGFLAVPPPPHRGLPESSRRTSYKKGGRWSDRRGFPRRDSSLLPRIERDCPDTVLGHNLGVLLRALSVTSRIHRPPLKALIVDSNMPGPRPFYYDDESMGRQEGVYLWRLPPLDNRSSHKGLRTSLSGLTHLSLPIACGPLRCLPEKDRKREEEWLPRLVDLASSSLERLDLRGVNGFQESTYFSHLRITTALAFDCAPDAFSSLTHLSLENMIMRFGSLFLLWTKAAKTMRVLELRRIALVGDGVGPLNETWPQLFEAVAEMYRENEDLQRCGGGGGGGGVEMRTSLLYNARAAALPLGPLATTTTAPVPVTAAEAERDRVSLAAYHFSRRRRAIRAYHYPNILGDEEERRLREATQHVALFDPYSSGAFEGKQWSCETCLLATAWHLMTPQARSKRRDTPWDCPHLSASWTFAPATISTTTTDRVAVPFRMVSLEMDHSSGGALFRWISE